MSEFENMWNFWSYLFSEKLQETFNLSNGVERKIDWHLFYGFQEDNERTRDIRDIKEAIL